MRSDPENPAASETEEDDDEVSPIEEVRLSVSNTDDPTRPVWTFRMWFLGLLSCSLVSFLNQFFAYHTERIIITQITVQVATLPIGHFMAALLPKTTFSIPGFGSKSFSFNPGPFNMKEHVLITIFANAGSAFGDGSPYAVGIVNIIKAFYGRSVSFVASWLLIVTTQASTRIRMGRPTGGVRGEACPYVVAQHPRPGRTFPQAAICENDLGNRNYERDSESCAALVDTQKQLHAVTAQQIGSGMRGLGVGALTLDWAAVTSFLFSPLISPFFAIVNVFVGYALTVYVVIPVSYWGLNVYNANRFPIFSSHLFTAQGQKYNIPKIVDNHFELNVAEYEKQGRIHLSVFFALTYGFGFATIASTLTHVVCFYGREIMERYRASSKGKEDIHTKLMRRYKDIPSWWFHSLLLVTLLVSLALCIFLKDQVQMPWWGLLFAGVLAFGFTLPISIITATTNQTPGLNIITEYVFGLIYPGRPIANVCFKTYGYISMAQAVSFLSDFKLGHYMKIPPRSMFLVQFIGTILAGTINIGVAWWLLNSIKNICHDDLLPEGSPWTCPGDRVFFDASVIWGLVGPKRIFGSQGNYSAMNWFFLGGALGPIIVWLLHKAFPKQSWIPLINLPVLLGATGMMPPATPLNYNAWIFVGTIFNFFIFRYRKKWWQRYNYVLSAALDSGVAFMTVMLYFSLGLENKSLNWWGNDGEHCPLAACPTAKGIIVDGCPAN
ncbi:hypothetical protein JHK84_041779 [Glycine max]|nr:hypothetical protein JHK85_042176 [Glycine max]KAG5115666.1 hypothetical protein JHK84_041779 [Glycine max]